MRQRNPSQRRSGERIHFHQILKAFGLRGNSRRSQVYHGGEVIFAEELLDRERISQIDPDMVPVLRAARVVENANGVNPQPRQAAAP